MHEIFPNFHQFFLGVCWIFLPRKNQFFRKIVWVKFKNKNGKMFFGFCSSNLHQRKIFIEILNMKLTTMKVEIWFKKSPIFHIFGKINFPEKRKIFLLMQFWRGDAKENFGLKSNKIHEVGQKCQIFKRQRTSSLE